MLKWYKVMFKRMVCGVRQIDTDLNFKSVSNPVLHILAADTQ